MKKIIKHMNNLAKAENKIIRKMGTYIDKYNKNQQVYPYTWKGDIPKPSSNQ